MSDGGYRIRNKKEIHFLTLTVVEWVDVFTRKDYRDIFINSVKYCQEKKGLMIYGWCVMSSHVHLLASARNNNLSDVIRDLKKFTSKKIVEAITCNDYESRKEWMLSILRKQALMNSHNTHYQFWIQDNQPKECYSAKFTIQKLNYVHNNPVDAGIVGKPEEYLYSSARDYHAQKRCGLLEVLFV